MPILFHELCPYEEASPDKVIHQVVEVVTREGRRDPWSILQEQQLHCYVIIFSRTVPLATQILHAVGLDAQIQHKPPELS